MGIYKRNGAYYVRIKREGKLIRKRIGTDREAAKLVQKELERQADLAAASNLPIGTVLASVQKTKKVKTFAQAAEEYISTGTFKNSSITSYNNNLKKHLLPAFGKKALNAITPASVRAFQSTLAKSGLSARRVNSIVQLMRSVFRQALIDEEIDKDPSQCVKRLPEPKAKIDPLSDQELASALANIDPHYQPLFTCLAFTGARPNEMIALRWTDIGWGNNEISITKGRVRGHEGAPKTTSSERVIPMAPEVRAALEQLKARKVQHSENYIFLTMRGQPVGKHLDLTWAKALRKAEVRHRASYQLRHTFATRCIINGFPLPYIAKTLGHSTIDTLIRHYAGWIDKATQSYDEMLKQGLGSSTKTSPINALALR